MAASKPPALLDTTTTNISKNWSQFSADFRNYIDSLSSVPPPPSSEEQLSILLNVIGAAGLKLFNQLQLSESELGKIDRVLEAFRCHCNAIEAAAAAAATASKPPIVTQSEYDVAYRRSVFHQRQQLNDEPFEMYLNEIQRLAASCSFGTQTDPMLLDRIKNGIADAELRLQLAAMPAITLTTAISSCRVAEMLANNQSPAMAVMNAAIMPRTKSEYFNSSSTECVLQTAASVVTLPIDGGNQVSLCINK